MHILIKYTPKNVMFASKLSIRRVTLPSRAQRSGLCVQGNTLWALTPRPSKAHFFDENAVKHDIDLTGIIGSKRYVDRPSKDLLRVFSIEDSCAQFSSFPQGMLCRRPRLRK